MFNNDLGMTFGKRLTADPSTLPSSIIDSNEFADRRKRLGLARPLERDWHAFDPRGEASEIYLKPPSERSIRRFSPQEVYQLYGMAKKLYDWPERNFGKIPYRDFVRENLPLIRKACLHGDPTEFSRNEGYVAFLAGVFCSTHNSYLKWTSQELRRKRTEQTWQ